MKPGRETHYSKLERYLWKSLHSRTILSITYMICNSLQFWNRWHSVTTSQLPVLPWSIYFLINYTSRAYNIITNNLLHNNDSNKNKMTYNKKYFCAIIVELSHAWHGKIVLPCDIVVNKLTVKMLENELWQKIITLKMADQGRSDFYVAFTMILCSL